VAWKEVDRVKAASITLDLRSKRNYSDKCRGNGRADVFGLYADARAAPSPLHRSPRANSSETSDDYSTVDAE
jgi:hypothetical protein